MPALPGHIFLGRANINGPVIGGYGCIASFGPYTVAASQTDLVQASMRIPCDFRLERISWQARVSSVAGTLKFYVGATLGALTTNLLDVASVNMGSGAGQVFGACLPLGESSLPTTDNLSTVAGVRDLVKGQYVSVAATTDATVGGTVDLNIQFYGFFMGHPNTLTESD